VRFVDATAVFHTHTSLLFSFCPSSCELQIEERIAGLHAAAAARIASLGEEKQAEYEELQEELVGVNERIVERENVLAHLERNIGMHEDTMKSEAYHLLQAGHQLTKEKVALQRQVQELEDELHTALSPQEVREKLTTKFTESKAHNDELEREKKRLEQSIEKLGDGVRKRESELAEARKHSSKARKYDAIYERDAKMDEFIAAFPQVKNAEIENKKKMKELVVALLRHLSKEINAAAQLRDGSSGSSGDGGPNAAKHGELKDEVSFKDKKLADSEKTLATLQADLAKRREELEKIESLDAKIGAEIVQLTGRIAAMQEEMAGFKSDDELRDAALVAKKELMVENARQKKAREAIRVQVSLLSAELEKKSKDLSNSEPAKRIDAWETKLKTHAGALFTLQDYLSTKKRESDFENTLKECNDITQSINQLLVMQR
jgi:chromosome segregation ATPase